MSELRKDPIVGRWVIVALERAKRPSDFESNHLHADFSNNLSQLPPATKVLSPKESTGKKDKFGLHQIIKNGCYQKIGPEPDLYSLFSSYKERILKIKENKEIKYVIIFRNYQIKTNSKSIRHPYSNLFGFTAYPKNTKREINGARRYYQKNKSCIYCDIISQELRSKERFILENENFVAVCPFASRFPLESWILPKKHSFDYTSCNRKELGDLSSALGELLGRMRRLLGNFAYTYVLHTGPLGREAKEITSSYHWYIELIPLLTRVAGFEWGTGFYINPTPPERGAEYLRKVKLEKYI